MGGGKIEFLLIEVQLVPGNLVEASSQMRC